MEPFRIAVTDTAVADLRDRLRRTRWPDAVDGAGWEYGTDPGYLREITDYWATTFDWRAQERRLNTFAQFGIAVDGRRVHGVLERGRGPAPLPVLVLHGWPGSFVQMLDLLPLLTDPAAHGGAAGDAFDVVVGSLPGFAFSDAARRPGLGAVAMAHRFHRLMTRQLGYRRYAVRGSDFGASVAEQLGAFYPEAVVGLHLSGTTPRADDPPARPSPAVRQYIEDVRRWRAVEVGYGGQQSTRPQTLAYALNDSPVGLAGWILEKFRRWSDCEGPDGRDVERRFTKDQLLTNISVYWFTATIGSSIRMYYETEREQPRRPDVPAAWLMSSKDMFPTPREWVERAARVDRWTAVDRGGHFIEWEEPQLVAEDMRQFFRALR
ncbi:epoxide hydrolase family protein [Dactylosporangium sp. NPDC051541]|uniref:epoxide hydrolase family protein n=1 Tax=Dactylosporangium sp. NPDC051541 TaxID=3363977 RepID=UPI0037B66B34